LKLHVVKEILNAEVLAGADRLDLEIAMACGADLMSDVLALTKAGSLLLTGLTNTQMVTTAHVLDIAAIVVVRGKTPCGETIDAAREHNIPLLATKYTLFEAAGRLYAQGLAACR